MSRPDHGLGCVCTGDPWEDHYACPWFPSEVDVNTIPMSLSKCRACGALLDPWDDGNHMRWHERLGHLNDLGES